MTRFETPQQEAPKSVVERFVGEYRLLETLPSWGAELWLPNALHRAEHVLSRQAVLLAVLHPELLEAEQTSAQTPPSLTPRTAVWDRALRLAGIDHHTLPELIESQSPKSTLRPAEPASPVRTPAFLAWQLERGPTLRERLLPPPKNGGADPQRSKATLGPAEALRVVQHVAEGIDAVHSREEIHGGLCPANILLTPIGARLLAPGFCSFNHRQEGGEAAGWIYRAPEQLPGGTGNLGPACDVWALGTILYELLAGQPAFAPLTAESPPAETLVQLVNHERSLGSEEALQALLQDLLHAFAAGPNGELHLPAEALEILRRTLCLEPSKRTRADEVAQLAHLAARELSQRGQARTQARGGASTNAPASAAASAASVATADREQSVATTKASRPWHDDWPKKRSWLQQRRAAFDAEEEDTPTWFLWLLPAAIFAVFLLMLLALVLLAGGRGN